MKFILTLLTFYLICTPAHSLVNLRNGSYFEKWVDYIDPQIGIDLRIERHYSSRSLFEGIFGYGWCSSLETKLVITSDGILNLVECGGGLEVTYYPSNFDLVSVDATINAIVEDYRRKKKMNESDIANLKTQLRFNTKMRFEYANKIDKPQIDIKKIKTKNNTFLAKAKGVEKIVFDGQSYKRTKVDGWTEVFDNQGRLVKKINPAGQFLKISYKNNRIYKIISNDRKKQLTFIYERDVLKKITNGNKYYVTYKFEGDNLVSVKNMWSKEYNFEYDKQHNMTKVYFPDNTAMTMGYDLDNDWITSHTNRKNCREDYRYESVNGNKDHYFGKYQRYCEDPKTGKKSAITKGYNEFWYKKYAFSDGKYLHQVSEEYNNDKKLAIFHPYFGKPNKLEHNQFNKFFFYTNNGLVNREETKQYKGREIFKWQKTKFNYNRKNFNITSISQKNLNKLGKVTDSLIYKYQYDRKGFLSQSNQSTGEFVKMTYDKNGKLDIMTDHQKNELKVSYRVGVDKPVEISQTKVGKVKITYGRNGEIDSLESEGNRNIASSVVEKFVEMIKYLGPKGKELGI